MNNSDSVNFFSNLYEWEMARLLYEYLHSVCHTLFCVESAKQRYIGKGRCVLIACSDNYRSFSLTSHGGSFPFEKDFIFSCVCVCVLYMGYIVMRGDVCRGQEKALGLQELELQVVVNCLTWGLALELGSSGRPASQLSASTVLVS